MTPCEGLTPESHRAVARGIIGSAFASKNWRTEKPLDAEQRVQLAHHTSCSDRPKRITRFRQDRKEAFGRYRHHRRIAPFPCSFAGSPGKFEQHWVVPCEIVCGESRGRKRPPGNPRDSYYQIIAITWGAYGGLRFAPYPAAATKLENDIIADRIKRAAGLGQWYGHATSC